MRINTNVAAFATVRTLNATETAIGKSLEKLSSGYRINRAADDAAGLVISQKLRAEISGLKVAARNVQDGISLLQVVDGALNEIHQAAQRIQDLYLTFQNATTDSDGQAAINAELGALVDHVGALMSDTTFGDTAVLEGSFVGVFQVGTTAGETVSIDLTYGGGLSEAADAWGAMMALGSAANPAAVPTVRTFIDGTSMARARIGAMQNRLESTMANLQTTIENLGASESRIRDTDMAAEMVNFTRHQILVEAGTAMLAQASRLPETTLRLLG